MTKKLLVLVFAALCTVLVAGSARAEGPPPYPVICDDYDAFGAYCNCLCNSGPYWARMANCPTCGGTTWVPTCAQCFIGGNYPDLYEYCGTSSDDGFGTCIFIQGVCYGWGTCIHT